MGTGNTTREATARDMLRQAWFALGGDPSGPERVRFAGSGQGLLPSRLAALPAMLAAVGAATLAAAELDAVRSERHPHEVVLDVEHVAVAAVSERHAELGGTAARELFAPLSRFWRTGDGWLRLHANYPWHRARALQVLGTGDDPADVAAAIARWRGTDLEDALAAAGALGYTVRNPEQWRAHPQADAVAGVPLVVHRPHAGPGRRLPPGRAAQGVRVLDLTRVIAGPVATRVLAGWGADVLRIDSPHLPELPAQAVDTLPGKRSALLDLATDHGRQRLQALLDQADVLVHAYRPGALARFGIDPDRLRQRHPHLSVVSLSAWGGTGPWGQRRGFDSLVQSATGIAALEGSSEAPGALPAQVLDHATGYLAAAAALHALARAAAGHLGSYAQLSLARTAQWLLAAGPSRPEPARAVDTDPYLVTLHGADQPVRVVAPPGRTDDLRPAWTATTRLGADPAEFGGSRRAGSA